jgi:hypothetical protein
MSLNLEALETSFDLVAPRGDELMDVFYARLFAAAPAVEPLFAGTDLRRQKTMLLGAPSQATPGHRSSRTRGAWHTASSQGRCSKAPRRGSKRRREG